MNFDRKLLPLLALPFAGALIPLLLWHFVNLKPTLTNQEKALMKFSSRTVTLTIPRTQTVAAIECPVRPLPSKKAVAPKDVPSTYPPVPLEAMFSVGDNGKQKKLEPPKPVFKLSMVMIDEGSKTAIINNRVLKEGEKLGTYRVTHIEKDRVQLKGVKGELWVHVN